MTKKQDQLSTGEFVFKPREDGNLDFVGDFEGLYSTMEIPWGQSGDDERMKEYYDSSRRFLVDLLKRRAVTGSLLEVGCGLGYVSARIARECSFLKVGGMDISSVAIEKAKATFPQLSFQAGNICQPGLDPVGGPFDTVVMNEVLWYTLHSIDTVFENFRRMLAPNGLLIISTAFPADQRFGRDTVDGFNGLISYLARTQFEAFSLVEAVFHEDHVFQPNGVVALKMR